MNSRHMLLALMVAMLWGINFTIIQIGLGAFPPLLLAALRFVLAALPVLFLPRPAVSWPKLIAISTMLFIGQYGFLFTSMAFGMPAGLASIVLQSQAFITILIASIVLRERPQIRQIAGSAIALAGLAVIGGTVGSDFTMLGLGLCLASAVCWAIGNVQLRSAGKVDMLAMIVWLSLIPPIPLFGLSLLIDGPASIWHALTSVHLSGIASVVYISVISTIVCFGIWAHLLKLYPAATVAPFSLLVPLFGAASAAVVLGEKFEPARLVGMTLVLAGLVVVVAPISAGLRRLRRAVS